MEGRGQDRYLSFSFFPLSDSVDEASVFLPCTPSLPPSSGLSCHSQKPDVQVTLQGCNQKMSRGMAEQEMLTEKKYSILGRPSACLLPALELAGLPALCAMNHPSLAGGGRLLSPAFVAAC